VRRRDRHWLLTSVLALVGASSVAAQETPATLAIDHAAVSCVVAGKFPRLVVRIDPAADVSRVLAYFRPEGAQGWYFVPMKAEAGVFAGALPKPKKELKAIEYYIEATDRVFGMVRTADYRADVVSGPGECQPGGVVAGTVASASILLQTAAGAASIPAGFANAGVTTVGSAAAPAGAAAGSAGGSGISGTTLAVAGGVVAAGAAAVGIALAVSDDITHEGTYATQIPVNFGGCVNLFEVNGTVGVKLESKSDGAVSGQGKIDQKQSIVPNPQGCGPCGTPGYGNCPGELHAGPSPLNGNTGQVEFAAHTSNSWALPGVTGVNNWDFAFSGAANGDAIPGTLTIVQTTPTSTGSTGRGSATLPVTLTKK
jgi:hypothetical protein